MYSKPRISYISQFFILLGLIAGGLLFGSLVSLIVFKAMVGGSLMSMEKDMMNPANADALKVVQLVSTFFVFLIPAIIYARIVNPRPIQHLGMKTKANALQKLFVAIMVLAGFGLTGALGELNHLIPIPQTWEIKFKAMEKAYMEQVKLMANMKNFGEYFISLIIIALAPAIFEEVLFRGALQQLMVKWTRNVWIGIIITSIIFSAIHMSYYGFLARFALGMVLGFMFYYSKSLWTSILAHFLNNGIAVTAMYFYSRKGKLTDEVLDEKFPLWVGLIALVIIIGLFRVFKKESIKLGTFDTDNTYVKSNNPFDVDENDLLKRDDEEQPPSNTPPNLPSTY
jgi:membrane protease YdiL (CAAX protease family)